MSARRHLTSSLRIAGFTVVELLVAIAISLLLLAGVMALFANSRTSYESNDRLARIQENGRFALAVIARDIRAAGHLGCAKRTPTSPLVNGLANASDLMWNFGVSVQGFDASSATWVPALTAPLDTDAPTAGSDVLVVRGPKSESAPQKLQSSMVDGTSVLTVDKPATSSRAITAGDIAIAASCEDASVFQVTTYTPGGTSDVIAHTAAGTPGNASADLGNRFYANTAEVYPVQTSAYFVDAGPNGNSLYRRVGAAAAEELVEGVDSFQVQFGIDSNGDHMADSYINAAASTNWDEVVSVRIALLVRSLDEYGSDIDTQARTILGATVPAFNDRRQRLLFTTTATLRNKVF